MGKLLESELNNWIKHETLLFAQRPSCDKIARRKEEKSMIDVEEI